MGLSETADTSGQMQTSVSCAEKMSLPVALGKKNRPTGLVACLLSGTWEEQAGPLVLTRRKASLILNSRPGKALSRRAGRR